MSSLSGLIRPPFAGRGLPCADDPDPVSPIRVPHDDHAAPTRQPRGQPALLVAEWFASETVVASRSPKTVAASSKLTLCFARLPDALSSSHSNRTREGASNAGRRRRHAWSSHVELRPYPVSEARGHHHSTGTPAPDQGPTAPRTALYAASRTSIFPVTAAEINAVRSSLRRSIASRTFATSASIRAR